MEFVVEVSSLKEVVSVEDKNCLLSEASGTKLMMFSKDVFKEPREPFGESSEALEPLCESEEALDPLGESKEVLRDDLVPCGESLEDAFKDDFDERVGSSIEISRDDLDPLGESSSDESREALDTLGESSNDTFSEVLPTLGESSKDACKEVFIAEGLEDVLDDLEMT